PQVPAGPGDGNPRRRGSRDAAGADPPRNRVHAGERRAYADRRAPRRQRHRAGGRAVGRGAGRYAAPDRPPRGSARGARIRAASGAGEADGPQRLRVRARPADPRSIHRARRRSRLPLDARARRPSLADPVPRSARRRGGRECPPVEAGSPVPRQVLRREGGRGGGAGGAGTPLRRRPPRGWGLGTGGLGIVEPRGGARGVVRGPPSPESRAPNPASASSFRHLHPVPVRLRRGDCGPALGARTRTVRGRDAPAHGRRRPSAAAAAAAHTRFLGCRARGYRGTPRAAAPGGVRGGAVLGAERGGAYGAQPPSPLRRRALSSGARRRSRGRTVRRARQPAGALRRDVRLSRRHQGGSAARRGGDAGSRAPAAQRDAAGPRRARPADDRTAAERRAGAEIREELSVAQPPLVPVIVGPTGVGKTAVAAAWSALEPITVVSADARQAYRGLDIGTAK